MDVSGNIDTKDPDQTNEEVKRIYHNLFGSSSFNKVERALNDIVDLFYGRYPGYLKCDTEYHNLEHTLQVYLAMARLFDGVIKGGYDEIPEEFAVLGLIAAIGHDSGFIKEGWDREGTGAKYTLTHARRSEEFMAKYLPKLDFDSLQVRQVQNIIGCTGVPPVDLSVIDFTSDKEKEVGFILGTADYLGQMSDPDYLNKLPLLYEEFKEGGVPDYTSSQQLIDKTPQFYRNYVMKRLTDDFNSVYQVLPIHFGGRNLYIEGVERNIRVLEESIKIY